MNNNAWTKEKLLEHHKKITSNGLDILVKKNSDYSGIAGDVFANFRNAKMLNLKPEKAILVRLMDKMSRLNTFIDRENFLVNEESFQDTVVDAVNYLVILSAMVSENKESDSQDDKKD